MFSGTSGMKDDVLLSGRPYGGVAILWKREFCKHVTPLKVSCRRLCAVKVHLEEAREKLLLLNCYMPCDTYLQNECNDEFLEVMDAVESLVAEHSECRVIWGGDFNADTARGNAHDRYYKQVVERLGFVDLWQEHPQQGRYTYCDLAQRSYSCIDRVALSTDLLGLLLKSQCRA